MSGAPVVVESGGNPFTVGMLWLGQPGSATSRMIAADTIAAFLAEEPVSGFSVEDLPELAFGGLRIPSREWTAEKHGPAAMLVANYEIVPFQGRKSELADIDSWAFSLQGLGVRVYHERGGVGKTRLAIEACKRLSRKGSHSGFLVRDPSAERVGELFAATEEAEAAGLFIVIDYAETSSVALRNVLTASSEFAHVRVRLMLLARGLGDWWETVRHAGEGVGDILTGPATEEPIKLGPVGVSPEFRETEFRRAATAFARKLGRDVPVRENPDLDAPDTGTVSYSVSVSSSRSVAVTLIVPTSKTPCVPSWLSIARISPANGFSTLVSAPTPLSVQLLNDCGQPVVAEQVAAAFGNGDPPISMTLTDASTGLYSGTWYPGHAAQPASNRGKKPRTA